MTAGVAGTPLKIYTKDPDAKLDYIVDWASWLNGDTISTSAWSVPTGITEMSSSPGPSTNTTTTATIWLEGGTVGTAYDIINSIVTTAGRQDDRTFQILIAEK